MKKEKLLVDKTPQAQTDCFYKIDGRSWRIRVNEKGISLGVSVYDRNIWYDLVIEGLFPVLRVRGDDSEKELAMRKLRDRPIVERVVGLAVRYHEKLPLGAFFNESKFRDTIYERTDEELGRLEHSLETEINKNG
jgi:hypothetical protein